MSDRWEDSEVLCLLEIWGDSEIQKQFEGSTRNKKIYETISERLAERDIQRTAVQCREKVKTLRAEYKYTYQSALRGLVNRDLGLPLLVYELRVIRTLTINYCDSNKC